MIGRRVQTVDAIERGGDYCGPISVTGYADGDRLACFFLPPNVPDRTTGLFQVQFPPHTYRECEDGSLEVRASIGAYGHRVEDGYLWHGFLNEGHVWQEC